MPESGEILIKILKLKAEKDPRVSGVCSARLISAAWQKDGTEELSAALGVKTDEDRQELIKAAQVWGAFQIQEASAVRQMQEAYGRLTESEQALLRQTETERRQRLREKYG